MMRWLRWVSWLVPRDRRGDWLEEWQSELWQIERAGEAEVRSALDGRSQFLAGALPHALWERRESVTMYGIPQDIRWAFRSIIRQPGLTLVAVLSLGLGLGVGSVVYTLIDGLLLSTPAEVSEPDRLVQLGRDYADDPRFDVFSYPNYRILSEESRTLSGIAGSYSTGVLFGQGAEAASVRVEMVTPEYFEVLGTPALLGRTFDSSIDRGAVPDRTVVLSHAFWATRFGSDPSVLGSTVSINQAPFVVIGVLPSGFNGVEVIAPTPSVYIPAALAPDVLAGSRPDAWVGFLRSWIALVGRIADGETVESVTAEMETLAPVLQAAHDNNEGTLIKVAEGVGLTPDERQEARTAALLLLAIAGVVVLITCANLSSLMLARADARRNEVGVRVAMGAGRSRLTRQFLTEGAVLSLFGGALAFGLAWFASRFLPSVLPWSVNTDLTPGVLVFVATLLTALVMGLLFGAAPLLSGASRVGRVVPAGGSSEPPRTRRVQSVLTVVQVALALALVSGNSLLSRSLLQSRSADPGFAHAGMVAASMSLGSGTGYTPETGRIFMADRIAALRALPEVSNATVMTSYPISGGQGNQSFLPEGMERPERPLIADAFSVGPNFFETLDIPILEGRGLSNELVDSASEPEVVVNETFARRWFPEGDAIGSRIESGGEATLYRIVGVVADVRHRSIREDARPTMYLTFVTDYSASAQYIVQLRGGEAALEGGGVSAVRETLLAGDPDIPVRRTRTGTEMVQATMSDTRTLGYLIGVASILSLFLAAVGLHGVIAFRVARRKREMGIRMAVGAKRGDVIGGVMRGGFLLLVPGLILGLLMSIGLGSTIESLLFGVAPFDLLGTSLNIAVLAGAAFVALLGPAIDSTRVDIVSVLRDE